MLSSVINSLMGCKVSWRYHLSLVHREVLDFAKVYTINVTYSKSVSKRSKWKVNFDSFRKKYIMLLQLFQYEIISLNEEGFNFACCMTEHSPLWKGKHSGRSLNWVAISFVLTQHREMNEYSYHFFIFFLLGYHPNEWCHQSSEQTIHTQLNPLETPS